MARYSMPDKLARTLMTYAGQLPYNWVVITNNLRGILSVTRCAALTKLALEGGNQDDNFDVMFDWIGRLPPAVDGLRASVGRSIADFHRFLLIESRQAVVTPGMLSRLNGRCSPIHMLNSDA